MENIVTHSEISTCGAIPPQNYEIDGVDSFEGVLALVVGPLNKAQHLDASLVQPAESEFRTLTLLHDDWLFPAATETRAVARRLFLDIRDLPIVSPHGHRQAGWSARRLLAWVVVQLLAPRLRKVEFSV